MAHISEDRVLETATANTTVSFTTTGAIVGFRTFASSLAVGDTCFYVAQEVDASGTPTGNWEVGLGTYSAANTLTRTTILESSNANAAVTFGAGTIQLALTLTAGKTVQFDNVHAVPLPIATSEPATPTAGKLVLYSNEELPNFTVLKIKNSFGENTILQDSIMFSRVIRYQASGGAMAPIGGAALTTLGTAAAIITTPSGNALGQMARVQVQSTSTAGALAGLHCNGVGLAPVYRGSVSNGDGFLAVIRFGLVSLVAGNRGFFGLSDVSTAPTNIDPLTATAPGKIGLAFNANTGNLTLVHNLTGTAPTQIDLGANFPISGNILYELVLFCPRSNGTVGNIYYRVRRYVSSTVAPSAQTSGELTTNIPSGTTLLHPVVWMTNNATAAQVSFQIGCIGIETVF